MNKMRGRNAPAAVPSIRELIENYSLSKRLGDAQERSLALILPHFGSLTVAELMPRHVQSYNRKRRGVQDSTRRRELGALIAVLNWAAKTRLIGRESVPHIDLPESGAPRQLFMSEEEARAFLDEALRFPRFNGRIGLFVAIALNTGARKEAIFRLTWDRVDLRAGTLDFRVPGAVVTRKRRVALPLNDEILNVLRKFEPSRCDGSNLVIGQGSIRNGYEAFTKSISMSWVTPHVLRHTAASIMLNNGVPIWEVAGVLGDTPATVTRVYGHHLTSQLRGAVGALGRGSGAIVQT